MIQTKPSLEELVDSDKFAGEYDKGNYGKNVLGVSHGEYISFIRIGKLCELVFVRILKDNYIECECEQILIPCPDRYRKGPDLILTHSRQEVDVKAANKPSHSRLLVREDQFKAHIYDLYVGAKYIDNCLVEYHGYIAGQELSRTEPWDFGYGLCRHLFLKDLRPIERFIQLCKEKKKVE